jgi:hypothetical protein
VTSAFGRAEVTPGRARTPRGPRGTPLLAALLLLAGCKESPRLAGVASGTVAGGATGNIAIGLAVGVATDAAARAGIQYVGRVRTHAEQAAIAAAAGDLPVGQWAAWRVEHAIPVGDEHGELRVVRLIDNPLTPCKEVAFSVETGSGAGLRRSWYATTLCREGGAWGWAAAEPAVERWGYLQ